MLSIKCVPYPAIDPKPGTTLTTPSGMPASFVKSSINSITEQEASSLGFITTQFPAANAGASFFMVINKGWFHGTIWPTTPKGTY